MAVASGAFAVRGAFPAGVDVGNVVAVKAPSCHMIIQPGSLKWPTDAAGAFSFDAIQVPTP